MMRKAAIGIFDSGIGGLTVASEIARSLPHEDIIYLGDTARLPYGTRSPETVQRYAEKAVSLLLRYPIKVLVVACNTATAYALEHLTQRAEHPVLGVVDPGAIAAVAASATGKIGVSGTEGTIRSGAYQRAILERLPSATLTSESLPLLVSLAEEGWVEHPVSKLTVETYLKPFVEAEVDTLVLGCTHFPVFKSILRDAWERLAPGAPIALIDSAEEVTRQLRECLEEGDLSAPDRAGRRSFFCTDAVNRFQRVGANFFEGDLSGVTLVDL